MIGGNEKYPPSQQYSSGSAKIACAVSCAAVLKLVGSVVALPLAGLAQSRRVFVWINKVASANAPSVPRAVGQVTVGHRNEPSGAGGRATTDPLTFI